MRVRTTSRTGPRQARGIVCLAVTEVGLRGEVCRRAWPEVMGGREFRVPPCDGRFLSDLRHSVLGMGELRSAVEAMLAVDVAGLELPVVEEQFCELTELMDVLEVARLARLARLDAARVGDADHAGSTAGWVREVTLVSPNAAGRAVRLARDLRALPQLAAAVGDGRVSVEHARVIAGLRKDLPDPAVVAALPSLIEAAMGCTPLELGRWVADVRHSYAPERVRVTEVTQYEARSVDTAVTFQGVGDGRWVLPPVLHETVMTALHAFSKPVVGDDRSPAQRRADALVTIAELALASGQAPARVGCVRTCRCWCRWRRWSGGSGRRQRITGMARRRRWIGRGGCAVMRGCPGWCMGRPVRCWMRAARHARSPRRCGGRSWRGTGGACGRTVTGRPPGVRRIIASTGLMVGRRVSRTVCCCAAGITTGCTCTTCGS